MPNDVTINISVGSAPGGQAGSGGQAGDGGTVAAAPSGDAPAPLPLDQLRAGYAQEDPTAPGPSPRNSPSADDRGDAPAPLPLDELRPDGGASKG